MKTRYWFSFKLVTDSLIFSPSWTITTAVLPAFINKNIDCLEFSPPRIENVVNFAAMLSSSMRLSNFTSHCGDVNLWQALNSYIDGHGSEVNKKGDRLKQKRLS